MKIIKCVIWLVTGEPCRQYCFFPRSSHFGIYNFTFTNNCFETDSIPKKNYKFEFYSNQTFDNFIFFVFICVSKLN